MSDLADRECVPCKGDVEPMKSEEIGIFHDQLDGWEVVDDHHLRKRYETEDFAQALDLVERLSAVSEEQNHHPVLTFSWGWVEAKIWTHKIDGLAVSDFVLAARFDRAAAR